MKINKLAIAIVLSITMCVTSVSPVLAVEVAGDGWILRGGEAACPAVAEPPVRTDGATRLLTITRVRRGECHRPHALNGLSLDLLHGC